MGAELHLARRYLVGLRRRTDVATVTLISLLGLALGVMALVVTLALLDGFQSTIRRELGEKEADRWDEPTLNAMMAEEFQKLVGSMPDGQLDDALVMKMKSLENRLHSPTWLFQKGKKLETGRDVKIRSGATVIHRMHKAQGGLIRSDFEVIENVFGAVSISGDFFCFPEDGIERLEARLEGTPMEDVQSLLEAFYAETEIEIPGISIDDWLKLLAV